MTDSNARFLCAQIGASTWSDALDHFRIAGVARGLTWRTGAPPLAGRAVTVREETVPLGDVPVSAFDVGRILAAAGPGDVLVVDMAGAEVSTCGGLAARAAVARRIEGIVVDGGCRDIDEIRATGFRALSRHVTPLSGKGRARVVSVNTPVCCGGVIVSPGDYVVADETGVVVIPSGRLDEVLALAERLHQRDRSFEQAIASGKPWNDIAASLGPA